MKYKHIALGFVTSFAALAIGISVANYSGQFFPQRAEPVIYGLTLDSSNRIATSYSSTERSISTASGNCTVNFNYTNVSPLIGGHCTIENGGQLVNSDHILSIEELRLIFQQLELCVFAPHTIPRPGGRITMLFRGRITHYLLIHTILNSQH